MKKPMPKGEKDFNVIAKHIGDDELWDDLEDLKKGQDMVPAIKKAMKRLGIKEEVQLDEARKLLVKDFRMVIKIAIKHINDMQSAIKDIENYKKGLSNHPDVMDILKNANEEVNEAKRIRPIKGLWTPKQMYTQVARTEKAAFELRQHADFIFQMDADVGPSMSRNSGLYMDVYDSMTAALDKFDQAIKDAKRIKHPD